MPKKLGTPRPNFYLDSNGKPSSKPYRILAVMFKNGVCYKVATGEAVLKKYWDAKAQRVHLTKVPRLDVPEFERLNNRLDDLARTMKEVWDLYYLANRRPLTNTRFNELVSAKIGKTIESITPTLLEFASTYVEERAKEKGERHPTVNNLRYGYKNLKAYSEKFGEVDFDHVNFEFLERFRAWLFKPYDTKDFSRKALNQNSAAQIVSAIKQFISEARKKEYTTNTITKERGFSVKKSETNRAAFFLEELETIYKADLSKHPQKREMERTRILVFVGCCTGARRVDWGKIKRELVEVIDGEEMINVLAQKTKRPIGLPFLPIFKKVLEECDWGIPQMATQRFNENIKELCRYVGIERRVLVLESVGGKQTTVEKYFYEVVSSHCCRRFFISTMLLLGVPASQLMPITGHSSERQLRHYAAIEGRQNAANVSKQFRRGMMEFLGITNKE